MSRSPLPLLPTLTGPTLPASVELMIQRICRRATPRAARRRSTAGARKARTQGTGNLSPSKRSAVSISPSPVGSPQCLQDSEESEHVSKAFCPRSPIAKHTLFSACRENSSLLAQCDLEFRKTFLILNYTGSCFFVCRRKLEEHMKVDDIMMLKDLPMRDFETKVWDAIGKDFINKEDRIQVGVGNVRHKRLVNLIGCCAEGDECLLVAKYMPHDTLSKHLFHCWELLCEESGGPDGLRIYLAFCIQDNDSAEDETNHDSKSEMNCIKSFKAFCLLNAC
ncbi:hypothetical protein RHSIM_Rhsim01G0146500 [Rhododendron simsii]|uniref:Uncharacterized protein n=1 Tax=Rhododendron simsii TaxID=118357 RepID=A0A834HJF4_RHOSS|nr:hypothetical protein RHSIM_Rhsim01G0146500 [Rhododendron simsii]